jgi:hypothetical protein
MMAVASQFAGKSDTLSVLPPSILYLLAGDSVPEPARVEVIQAAQAGRVTVAEARRTVRRHTGSDDTGTGARPEGGAGASSAAGKCTVCGRALSDPASVGRACGPTCAANAAGSGAGDGGDPPVLTRDYVAVWLDPDLAGRLYNAADSGPGGLAHLSAADARALARALADAMGW